METDWRTFATTFTLVFLAEFGDKTQLAVFTLTAQGKPRLMVLLGGVAALAATTVLAVAAGSALRSVMTERFERWVRIGAGLAFVAMGALFLLSKDD